MTGKYLYEITDCRDASDAKNQMENLCKNKLGVALVIKSKPVSIS